VTPSELLLAAADRIRDLAAAASPGLWLVDRHYVDAMPALYERTLVCIAKSDGRAERDAAWIAALSPAVAPHLEAWLRWCAKSVQVTVEDMGWPANGQEAAALRFALTVLGMTVEEAEAGASP